MSVLATLTSSVVIATLALIFNATYQKNEARNRERLREEAAALHEKEAEAHVRELADQKAKADHDARLGELQLVANLLPALSSPNEDLKKHAFLTIKALANAELMTRLALSDGGTGAQDALVTVAASAQTSQDDRRVAFRALRELAAEPIKWFVDNFGGEAKKAVQGTPFTPELVAAIAYQETGYIWFPLVRKKLEREQILKLCVGDTLDASRGRMAWPRTKAELLSAPQGEEMFSIAHQALVDLAGQNPSFSSLAAQPDKFCHAFGIFPRDLQFFKSEPEYFLTGEWQHFERCAAGLVQELKSALTRMHWGTKSSLTEDELVLVAVAYNKGSANPSQGARQGFRSDQGIYYGESVEQVHAGGEIRLRTKCPAVDRGR